MHFRKQFNKIESYRNLFFKQASKKKSLSFTNYVSTMYSFNEQEMNYERKRWNVANEEIIHMSSLIFGDHNIVELNNIKNFVIHGF